MSFDFSKFKGIHQVASERVWVNNTWSIEIPVGYTYSIDPETSGSGPSGKFLLHVQDSRDYDFNLPYSSSFNLVVYEKKILLKTIFADLSNQELLDTLEGLPSSQMYGLNVFKHSENLFVSYVIQEESDELTSYFFYIVVRGVNLIYTGQIRLNVGTIPDRKSTILQWLNTINTLTDDESLSFLDYSNTSKGSIPVKYSTETAPIDEGIHISVPQGFHIETDPELIGKAQRLMIVPDNYYQYDNPMEAPVGFYVASEVTKGIPTDISLASTHFKFVCSLEKPVFNESNPVILSRHADKGFSLSQIVLSGDTASAITSLYANDKSYFLHLVINYREHDFDSALALWDIDHLVRA